MEEEALKRFTDCVYFLASPLTCNKGIECEYRHNEIARLNPRDCWYWLSGSCLNPSCAFRHPPLDVLTELSSKSTPSQDQCSSLVKKVEVPCHFFHSGFCKKGDKCSFLHGRNGSNDSLKVSNKAATIVDSPQLDNKTSTGSNIVSVAEKRHPILSEAARKLSDMSEIKLKAGNKSDFKCQSASPNTSTSEFEEASKEGYIQSEAVIHTDHSSDEEVDIDIAEKDDWLESSPGFDVLVDDLSQNLGYDEDENYLVGTETDGGELNGHFPEYNYEDFAEYAGNLHEERRTGSCVEFDDEIDEQELMILRNISRYESEKMNPYLNQKRVLLPVRLPMDDLRGDDLRSYPTKDRADDDIRRNYSSPNMYFGHEKSRQFGRERYTIGKFGNNKGRFKATKSSVQVRRPQLGKSRNRYLENKQSKRPVYLADITRRPVTKKRIIEGNSAFSGPKTLDQIKEEKRRGSGNGDSYGKFPSVSKNSEDFQGPKPLSEILKEKRKICSVMNANSSIS